jgi:superoxide reductase
MHAESPSASESLFVGVNEPADMNDLTDLEKKHLPVIEAPEKVAVGENFEVRIEVGRHLEHPREHKHFIQFVDLYADDTFLARADFTSAKTCPKVRFCVSLEGDHHELRAYEHCNMHGTWVGRKPLTVTGG